MPVFESALCNRNEDWHQLSTEPERHLCSYQSLLVRVETLIGRLRLTR